MTKTKSNENGTKAVTAPPTGGGLPAAYNYGDDSNAGYEGTNAQDFTVPLMAVLQSNSPVVVENKIETARAGHLIDTVTQMVFPGPEGVILVPCFTEHLLAEFVPRERGGGFAGNHTMDSEIAKAAIRRNGGKRIGKLRTDDDPSKANELTETFYMYVLRLASLEATEAEGFYVLPFTGTKIKHYSAYMTRVRTVKAKPPLFANRFRLTTFLDKNTKGQFYNVKLTPVVEDNVIKSLMPKFEPDGATPSALFREAQGYYEAIRGGLAKAAYETQAAVAGEGPTDAGGDEVFG